MRLSLARVRAWRLIALTALGVPVGILGAATLMACFGAPVVVFAGGVLGNRPDVAAGAAVVGMVSFPAATYCVCCAPSRAIGSSTPRA